MTEPLRIDAHLHFWRLADRTGHWPPPSLAAIHRDFTPDHFAPVREGAGTHGSIAVQSLPDEADTHNLLVLADQHPFILGVVGWTDLKAPDAPARVAALARHPKLRGLRPMLQDLADPEWIADPAVDPAAHAMVAHRLVFDALVLPHQLTGLTTFARRHPALTVIIDHAAKPPIARGQTEPWRSHMAALAALPNVHCKVSGLLTEAAPGAPLEALLPYLRALWALFGPGRLVWGSDWPVLQLASTYAHWRDLSHAWLDAVGADEAARAAVLGGNAVRLYGLDGAATLSPPPEA